MNNEFWNNLIFHEEESNRGELLTAALLEVGGVRYPKFGNILILAGGSGSGKGHQLKNLIGMEGKILDIDRLKELALQHYGIRKTLQQKFGINVDDASNFKDPEFTGKVHNQCPINIVYLLGKFILFVYLLGKFVYLLGEFLRHFSYPLQSLNSDIPLTSVQ